MMAPFALDVAPPGEAWRRVIPSKESDDVREMISTLLADDHAVREIAHGREVNVCEAVSLDCSDEPGPATISGPIDSGDLRIWRFRLAALPLFG